MRYLKYTDKILLLVSTILFIIGLIMVFSSSNIAAFMRYGANPYYFLIKQSIILILGLILFLIIIRFSTKSYSAISWFGLILTVGFLIFVYFYGTLTNKARSWIDLGFFMFQPSELAKVVLIVWFSAFYELKRNNLNKLFTNFFPIGVSAFIAALIILQPDFGTAGVILILSFLVYLLIPIKRSIKIKVVLISMLIMTVMMMGYYIFNTSSFARQISRFDFLNPCSEEKFYDTGNQVCNSYIAFNNGSLTGKGLGNSTQKYLYLPESHTDFIFAIIVEECGFLGAIIIMILYAILLYRIIDIGNNSSSSRGSIICYGVAIYIFLHIAINLLGIMGWLPLTGIPLPFLSYGGSFTLCLILSLSMVQRVAIETRMKKIGIC